MRIVRLHVSDVTTPESHPIPNTVISNYAYLVCAPNGVLLFDTGLGPPHEGLDAHYRPRRFGLPALLSDVGVSVEDVGVIVNCHLHFDHCGGNQLFPNARVIVQRAELDEARQPGYTVAEWFDFKGAQLEVVDGEHFIWDGVRVVPSPGHTRGHQSLVIDTPEGCVILAGQVAESVTGFKVGIDEWDLDLQEAGRMSIARLKAMAPRRVLFAHDATEWVPGS